LTTHPTPRNDDAVVLKSTVLLSLFVLTTFPLAAGCTSSSCQPIPDGVYVAIGPDGGALFTAAHALPLAAPGADGASDASLDATTDAAPDAAALPDAATRLDAAILPDAATPLDAAALPDAATRLDAATLPDAATRLDAAALPDAATRLDAATRPDAATHPDAATAVDAGVDAATEVPITYTFHGGLPAPYDTWSCTKPTASCEMTYICTQGNEQVAVVTYYAAGTPGALAFTVTPPGMIVRLRLP